MGNQQIHILILVITIACQVTIPQADGVSDFAGWTCDEITPDLCSDIQVTEGNVLVNGINVHYWRYNTDASVVSAHWPMLALHGGPGLPHDYLLPLQQVACRGHEVIFYDQAGCGASPLPSETNLESSPWLTDPAYYAEVELPAVVSALGLTDYHLFGHSWGTILAQLFFLNAWDTVKPRSLILSGPLSDAQLYIRSQWDPYVGNLGRLPPFIEKRIRVLEHAQSYDSPEYHAISSALTSFFTCRTVPMPHCARASFSRLNTEIYVRMQGASEFTVAGVLERFNSTPFLPRIDVPTLLTSGEFDTMRSPVVDVMELLISDSTRVMFKNAAHFSMIDDPGTVNDVLASFMHRVENR